VSDTAEIVSVLKQRFPEIVGPHKEDICYATTNRQEAVRQVAPTVDAMVVVGAPNSSNSQRLKEVAEQSGCRYATLVQNAAEIDWAAFEGCSRVGVTAGASAPEVLVDEVIEAFGQRFDISASVVRTAEELVAFGLPRELRNS
jgi:4-hydroxy-3-methylbut-2-enyl diphosphate reductase